eukprot:CAMPEP_0172473056 /NCGR_PEP_ID=MMETSP1065-20121228/68663_1 /TAXON_ID=265537 /ORGANISM="Amphiprora paludosa, Strain CCMP125" /LENGTH=221 /DNA_ID=CAMNT_0013231225 /DNA_START=122 /DNA_END=787 /DNA_ORIENTATION=+
MMMPKDQTPQEKINQEWDGMAGEWDDLASGYAAGLHAVLWEKTGIEDPSTLTVVDFGCGTGLLTERLASQVTRVVALDASPKMVEQLQDKISTREGFENVSAVAGILGNLDKESTEFKQTIESLNGSVDVVVASSVINFIPDEDLEATSIALGKLLKPGTGLLFHTDWPSGEGEPADGMTSEKAEKIYAMAGGLKSEMTDVGSLKMGKDEGKVFFGLARKS